MDTSLTYYKGLITSQYQSSTKFLAWLESNLQIYDDISTAADALTGLFDLNVEYDVGVVLEDTCLLSDFYLSSLEGYSAVGIEGVDLSLYSGKFITLKDSKGFKKVGVIGGIISEATKDQIVADIQAIVGAANIKLLTLFDATGDETTLVDRSGNSHTVTLRDTYLVAKKAEDFTTGSAGLFPYIEFDSSKVWDTPSHADLSPTSGGGTDLPFSLVVLTNMSDFTKCMLMAKLMYTPTVENVEYSLTTNLVDKLEGWLWTSTSKWIGISWNTPVTSKEGTWNSVGLTYSGSKAYTGISLYFNGIKRPPINDSFGTYAGMAAGTAALGDYYRTALYPSKGKYAFAMYCSVELTPTQMTSLEAIFDYINGTGIVDAPNSEVQNWNYTDPSFNEADTKGYTYVISDHLFLRRGDVLDIIGQIVGQPRRMTFTPTGSPTPSPVLDDEVYTKLLRAKIKRNHWDGKLTSIRGIWKDIYPGGDIQITDSQDMTMDVIVAGDLSQMELDLISNDLIIPRPEGVLLEYVVGTGPFFGFDINNVYISGFSAGKWF